MPLNDLSLEELTELGKTIALLVVTGGQLQRSGFTPTFDLTPGEPTRITLPPMMPVALARSIYLSEGPETADAIAASWGAYQDAYVERSGGGPKPQLRRGFSPSIEAAPDAPGAVATDAPEPLDPPPAPGEVAGGDALSAAPSSADDVVPPPPGPAEATPPLAEASSDAGEAESGGGAVMAAAEPPAAPVPGPAPAPAPGSASALAAARSAGSASAPWTEEENARLVDLVSTGIVRLGMPKLAAIASAAHELGRGVEGVKSRCYNQLKARIDAAISALAMNQAQTETPSPEVARQDAPPPQADVQGEGAMPPVGDVTASVPEPDAGATPAPAPTSFIADPVTAHLMGLTDKGGWTVDRDLELMELSIAGWQPNEIALQLQMQANAIKPRFDTLTGLHNEEATGKKVRRFTREDVFAALTRLAGKAA